MQFTPDLIIHIVEALGILGIIPFLRNISRGVDRYMFERTNFPPHIHQGDVIYYPKGLKPEKEGQ